MTKTSQSKMMIEINNFIGINDFENGEKWTNLMNKLKDEIIKMI